LKGSRSPHDGDETIIQRRRDVGCVRAKGVRDAWNFGHQGSS
jgi:hypothetical protein